MLAHKGAQRTGKKITQFGLPAQVDENGLAVVLNKGDSICLNQDGVESILGEKLEFNAIDEMGRPRSSEAAIIQYEGLRGKKFKYTERVRHTCSNITTTNGLPVILDQFGHPYHTDALRDTQYYSLEGDIVTLNEINKVHQKLTTDMRFPIYIRHGRNIINLSYQIDSSMGRIETPQIVVATGGLSIPKIGATDFGYRLARQFGLHMVEPRAGLVPLTFDGDSWAPFAQLAGLALPVLMETGSPDATPKQRKKATVFAEDLSCRISKSR